MKKSQLYLLLIVLSVFILMMTLGGLGNMAMTEKFYWIPFVMNIPVYGGLIYFMLGKKREAEESE